MSAVASAPFCPANFARRLPRRQRSEARPVVASVGLSGIALLFLAHATSVLAQTMSSEPCKPTHSQAEIARATEQLNINLSVEEKNVGTIQQNIDWLSRPGVAFENKPQIDLQLRQLQETNDRIAKIRSDLSSWQGSLVRFDPRWQAKCLSDLATQQEREQAFAIPSTNGVPEDDVRSCQYMQLLEIQRGMGGRDGQAEYELDILMQHYAPSSEYQVNRIAELRRRIANAAAEGNAKQRRFIQAKKEYLDCVAAKQVERERSEELAKKQAEARAAEAKMLAAKQQQDKLTNNEKWAALALSGRLCGFTYELDKAKRELAMMRARLKILDKTTDEIDNYQKLVNDTRKWFTAKKVRSLDCKLKQIKLLFHCLPSLEKHGNTVGSPYGGEWCDMTPYAQASAYDSALPIEPEPARSPSAP